MPVVLISVPFFCKTPIKQSTRVYTQTHAQILEIFTCNMPQKLLLSGGKTKAVWPRERVVGGGYVFVLFLILKTKTFLRKNEYTLFLIGFWKHLFYYRKPVQIKRFKKSQKFEVQVQLMTANANSDDILKILLCNAVAGTYWPFGRTRYTALYSLAHT